MHASKEQVEVWVETAIEPIEGDKSEWDVFSAVGILIDEARLGNPEAFEGLEIVGTLQPYGSVYDRIADFLENPRNFKTDEHVSMAFRVLRDVRKERHDYAA